MANTSTSQNYPQNPGLLGNGVAGDDITHPQEQQTLPDRLPQSLIEWLARLTGGTLRSTRKKLMTQAK